MDTDELTGLFQELGVEPFYEGVCHTCYAVKLIRENPDRRLMPDRWIYPAVARMYETNIFQVIRRIRGIMNHVKANSPELFAEITKRWKKENVSVSVWLTALYLYTYVSTAAA